MAIIFPLSSLFSAPSKSQNWDRLVKKSPSGAFSPSCFQNCKMKFCSIILQFCRCSGLFDAKGNPDGFLSHFSSLRNFRLGSFLTVLLRAKPGISLFCPQAQQASDFVSKNPVSVRFQIVQKAAQILYCLLSYETSQEGIFCPACLRWSVAGARLSAPGSARTIRTE